MFAADIAAALRVPNWSVFSPASVVHLAGSGQIKPTEIETGVIVASTGDDLSRAASDAVVETLSRMGFDVKKKPTIEPGGGRAVWINVEPRPDSPQGEAKIRLSKN